MKTMSMHPQISIQLASLIKRPLRETFLIGILFLFAAWEPLDAASQPPLGRTFDFDFNNGPMKSRLFPQKEGADSSTSENGGIVLQSKFTPGMEGQALQSREATDGMILELDSNDVPTLPLVNGSIRFWFKPDWTSGEGPGGYGSLMSFGKWKAPPNMSGYWGLSLDPKGERIQFGAQSTEQGTTFIAASIKFTKGNWYEIVLSFDANASWIYIDGKAHGPGQGISFIPPDSALKSTGFAIGNNPQGYQPVKGLIDGFEIFNFPLSSIENQFKYFALSAQVASDPVRIRLQWGAQKKRTYEIKRRHSPNSLWKTLTSDLHGIELTDASPDLVPGHVYEYQIAPYQTPGVTNHIEVAAFTRPNHQKGKVLLLVDRTHWKTLEEELSLFREDLLLDGWEVAMAKAPRHVDSRWKPNVKQIVEVKALIQEHLGAPVHGLKVAILVGHVSVPYSGYHALDGHARPGDDHRGAWSCDAYYGDLDGVWHDGVVNHINKTHSPATNVPGDGKFDENHLPTRLEVAIGRIDFANLPSLQGGAVQRRSVRKSRMEVELLRQYLKKNHDFRLGKLKFTSDALIKSHLPDNMNFSFNKTAIINASRWYGHIPGKVRKGDGFLGEERSLWAFMAGRSGSASFASGVRRTRDFNQRDKGPRSAFLMLYSSWHGDWNVDDAFLRACLASPEGGLAAMSALVGPWHLQSLGRGECLAYGYLQSANQRPQSATRALAVLGDPTLGNYFTSAVLGLKMSLAGTSRQLNWSLPILSNVEGIYVYKFELDQSKCVVLDSLAPQVTHWTMPEETPVGAKFMVRIGEWKQSASGVFAHLSQGVPFTVE